MFLNVLRQGGSIWSDGVGPLEAFKKGIRAKLRARARRRRRCSAGELAGAAARRAAARRGRIEQLAAQLAPADVLAGPHGDTSGARRPTAR